MIPLSLRWSWLFLSATILSAATQTVDVGPGFAFNPSSVSITVGDTVTWRFIDPSHTTTSDLRTGPEVWDSGIVAPGGMFSHTFFTVGDHGYYCRVHSFPGGTMMNGVVRVGAALPVLSNVVPNSGSTAGGTEVVLSGSNFSSDCRVTFGGVAAATEAVISSSRINATTPSHSAGPVDVTVTCLAGASTLPGLFTFVDTLAITSVNPASGIPGTEITIVGTGFDSGASVRFDSAPAASTTVLDSTRFLAVVPSMEAGSVTITVTNPSGESAAFSGFVVLDPLMIPTLSPLLLVFLAIATGVVGWFRIRS